MRICVIPGSFDPPTNGHLDLIRRASLLFDKSIVLVAKNSLKNSLFSPEERFSMLKEIFKDDKKIDVDITDGLVAIYATEHSADCLVRGIRNSADYSYETEIFQVNKTIRPNLETLFLPAETAFSSIRSSSIRELALFNIDVSLFVPKIVNKKIREKMKEPFLKLKR